MLTILSPCKMLNLEFCHFHQEVTENFTVNMVSAHARIFLEYDIDSLSSIRKQFDSLYTLSKDRFSQNSK